MTVEQDPGFYRLAMQGLSHLVGHWLLIGDADADRLAVILADTARLTKLGQPTDNPSGHQLTAWAQGEQPPMWVARASLFLLVQMPRRPAPQTPEEAAAWAYVWLRLRDHDSRDAALEALPAHVQESLKDTMDRAWLDLHSQRLI